MARTKTAAGEVGAAASELEAVLQGFERATEAAARIGLGSRRNLEKAAQAIGEAAAFQPRIDAGVQRLLGALNAARERNERAAVDLQALGDRVREKSEACGALLARFTEIGDEARRTTASVQPLGDAEAARLSSAEKVERLSGIGAGLAALIARAAGLVADAREAAFGDVADEADSLRQQLQSVRNKVALLVRKLEAS